mmetsp:Transcript_20091/g.33179  ORF Transcript_20091/g.33179 Transcript_20091/m.33179 type:complete len:293 (-) Transcript_20091:20-898(-)
MDQPRVSRGKAKGKRGAKNAKDNKGRSDVGGKKRGRGDVNPGERMKKMRKGATKSTLQDKFKSKLESGQFRWLNEQLYTTTSEEAMTLFKKEPKLYDIYHRGFEVQVEKWPENPVRVIIKEVKRMPEDWVLGDFGCGNALIARKAKQKVHSFDLCKTNEHVTVANSADVPLDDCSLDVAIFCLSLMGTDFRRFLLESRRVLKDKGLLIVAEVKSRFGTEGVQESDMLGGIDAFKRVLNGLGFNLLKEDTNNKMFVLFRFEKQPLSKKKERKLAETVSQDDEVVLKSCRYKKR